MHSVGVLESREKKITVEAEMEFPITWNSKVLDIDLVFLNTGYRDQVAV
jgi:hypothetical protein